MHTSYSLAIRSVERISFVQNFDYNHTKSMPHLELSFNLNHNLKLPDNKAKSFRKHNIWAQPKLIGRLLQSSEPNTLEEKVWSLGGWGRSDQAGGNKKIDFF